MAHTCLIQSVDGVGVKDDSVSIVPNSDKCVVSRSFQDIVTVSDCLRLGLICMYCMIDLPDHMTGLGLEPHNLFRGHPASTISVRTSAKLVCQVQNWLSSRIHLPWLE